MPAGGVPAAKGAGGGLASRGRVFVLLASLAFALLWATPDDARHVRAAVDQVLSPGKQFAWWAGTRLHRVFRGNELATRKTIDPSIERLP